MPFLVAINLFYASTQLELNTLDLIAVVQAILGSKTAILYNLNSDWIHTFRIMQDDNILRFSIWELIVFLHCTASHISPCFIVSTTVCLSIDHALWPIFIFFCIVFVYYYIFFYIKCAFFYALWVFAVGRKKYIECFRSVNGSMSIILLFFYKLEWIGVVILTLKIFTFDRCSVCAL